MNLYKIIVISNLTLKYNLFFLVLDCGFVKIKAYNSTTGIGMWKKSC